MDDVSSSMSEDLRLDREAGSGALTKSEAWANEKADERSHSNDGRSETRTTFYYNGTDTSPAWVKSRDRHQLHRDPADRKSWESLASYNDGVGESDRKIENDKADWRRFTHTFCNQLDLTPGQRDRTIWIVDNIDLTVFRPHHITVEQVALGVISLVVDKDADTELESWEPDQDWIIYRDDFEGLMNDVNMERGDLWQVRKVVSNSEYFEMDE